VYLYAITYDVVLDHTLLQRLALMLPRVLWSQTSSPFGGELQRCHVSLSSRHRFPVEVGSGASMCPMAPGSTSPMGEIRCCHIYHGPQQAMDHMNKEKLSYPSHAARLACFQGMFVRYRSVCKTCRLLQCSADPADHCWTWLQ
jgi:hypothetical protein